MKDLIVRAVAVHLEYHGRRRDAAVVGLGSRAIDRRAVYKSSDQPAAVKTVREAWQGLVSAAIGVQSKDDTACDPAGPSRAEQCRPAKRERVRIAARLVARVGERIKILISGAICADGVDRSESICTGAREPINRRATDHDRIGQVADGQLMQRLKAAAVGVDLVEIAAAQRSVYVHGGSRAVKCRAA